MYYNSKMQQFMRFIVKNTGNFKGKKCNNQVMGLNLFYYMDGSASGQDEANHGP